MFGLEYVLAAIKILTNIGFAIVTAIPLSISWNCVAPKYLVQIGLPELFSHVPFWYIVAFLLCARFIGEYLNNLIPKFISISNSSTSQ